MIANEFEKLTSSYWDGHSINDGCEIQGFVTVGINKSDGEFPKQRDQIEEFLKNPQKPTETLYEGELDPSKLSTGTILRIKRESMMVERDSNILSKLAYVFSFGLRNTDFPWAEPDYHESSDLAVVSSIDRFREIAIQGLITFSEQLLEAGNSLSEDYNMRRTYLRGYTRTSILKIDQVRHSKLMEKLQANDRQVFSRVTQVQLFS